MTTKKLNIKFFDGLSYGMQTILKGKGNEKMRHLVGDAIVILCDPAKYYELYDE